MLDRCLKETLRLRPPIMTMMRMARTPQVSTLVGADFTSTEQGWKRPGGGGVLLGRRKNMSEQCLLAGMKADGSLGYISGSVAGVD